MMAKNAATGCTVEARDRARLRLPAHLGLLVPAGTCKFHPSCSGIRDPGAFASTGSLKGSALACWRVLRCNPWCHGGVDSRR